MQLELCDNHDCRGDTGTAHGCVVVGPHNSLWAFYTVRAAAVHGFERRLGMDPAYIGEDGELHVREASSLPRRLPTTSKGAEPTGWLPLQQFPLCLKAA
jgi:hypothetical protein